MIRHIPVMLGLLSVLTNPALSAAAPANGTFESGRFDGWVADPNWKVVDNSCGYYAGWQGKHWAWSGGAGEPATGVLVSKPFTLDKDGVRLLIAGWSSIRGSGLPRHWNYVTLNLASGEEIDRVYAPDTTSFVPVYLNGSACRGKRVVVRAVDDADLPTFSMLCIDDVRTAPLPADYRTTVRYPARPNARRYVIVEDSRIGVTLDRRNGSIVRVHDKVADLDLMLEPRLAGSFRFALPIVGQEPWQTIEANWIFGHEQRLTSAEVTEGRATLLWNAPLRNYLGQEFDADATMTVEVIDGSALFRLRIDNRTPHAVGETYFPVLGGLQGLGRTRRELTATRMVRPSPPGAEDRSLAGTGLALPATPVFRTFGNMAPFGDQGPEQFYAFPQALPEPWLAFVEPRTGRAALVGVVDPAQRELFARMELKPSGAGTVRDDGNWPRSSELAGAPVGVELSLVDCRGGPARRIYETAAVVVEFVSGGGPMARMAWRRHRPTVGARP